MQTPAFKGKSELGVDLGDIVRDIDELMVLNDEAYHIHDPKMAWFKSIEDIHNRLVQKDSELTLQVDVTATPKHNNGAIFVQTVSDYPLVEAISQNVVKHPILPDNESRSKLSEQQSVKFTEKYEVEDLIQKLQDNVAIREEVEALIQKLLPDYEMEDNDDPAN